MSIREEEMKILQDFGNRLVRNLQSRIPKVSGKSSRSIAIDELTPERLVIGGSEYIGVFEYGRGKTNNKGRGVSGSLRDKIKEWILAKGIKFEGMTVDSMAWAISKKIHKEGNLLFRSLTKGQGSGVLSEALTEGMLINLQKQISEIRIKEIDSQILKGFKK